MSTLGTILLALFIAACLVGWAIIFAYVGLTLREWHQRRLEHLRDARRFSSENTNRRRK